MGEGTNSSFWITLLFSAKSGETRCGSVWEESISARVVRKTLARKTAKSTHRSASGVDCCWCNWNFPGWHPFNGHWESVRRHRRSQESAFYHTGQIHTQTS
uniref:Secreted protein n=1 Tax=Parascaris univalens TaxID=6257 RepID=A0A915A6X1_PARUN